MICIHFRIFQLDPDSRKLSRLAAAISTVWPVIYNLDFVGLTCIHCYTVSWCHMTHIHYYSNMHLIPFPRVWIKYSTLGKSNIFLRLAWRATSLCWYGKMLSCTSEVKSSGQQHHHQGKQFSPTLGKSLGWSRLFQSHSAS